MPGSDWSNTPFEIVYEKAARKNTDLARLMFGVLAWEAFKLHPDQWLTVKIQFPGRDVTNRAYFRPEQPIAAYN